MKVSIRGYNGQGMGSGFIKWFTFGSVSHVSFVFETETKREEIEALQGKGVIRHVPNTHDTHDFVEYGLPVDEEQASNMLIEAGSLVGSGYDWKGVMGFVRRRKKHNLYKWFCSELVAFCCYKADYSNGGIL